MASKAQQFAKAVEEANIPLDCDTEIVGMVDEESGDDYATLLSRKIRLDAVKKEAETELKKVGEALLVMLATAGLEKVKTEQGYTLKVGYGRGASKINPTKLLERGVSVDDIQYATEEGKPYSFAQVVVPKEGK